MKIRYSTVFGTVEGAWSLTINISQESDNLLVLCMDENQPWNDVLRIYMIPSIEVLGQIRITITINGTKYIKFMIDEKPYKETWFKMKKERYLDLSNEN